MEITRDFPDFETLTYSTILIYLTLTPGGVSRGYSMEKPQGLPIGALVAGALQDRQAAEGAKLGALVRISQQLDQVLEELRSLRETAGELLERQRK